MFKKEKYVDLKFNGFKWIGHDKGIHSFSKKMPDGKFCVIECEEKQLKNGDIEFMTDKLITLSKERKSKYQKAYLKKMAK
jgi:hypothetical protein